GYGLLRDFLRHEALVEQASESRAQIVFNYLGQFDQELKSESSNFRIVKILAEGTEGVVSCNRQRPYQLGINGLVSRGKFRLNLDYNKYQYKRESTENLALEIKTALLQIVDHCRNQAHVTYTPSDFPLAIVTQDQLDKWRDLYPNMINLYASTPMQKGLLFHSMIDKSAY